MIVFSLPLPLHTFAMDVRFSVKSIIPDNQRDLSKSYFDLSMKSGQTQTIKVELRNETDQEIIVNTEANTGITNSNGFTDYSFSKYEKDATLKYPFSEIAKVVNKETKLPPKSTVPVEIKLKMPQDSFNGVILGGLHFYEKETPAETKKKNIQIQNHYSYTIGVALSETDKIVEPNLKLNKVKTGQRNFRNVVLANIQNTEAVIVKNLSIDAKVYEENGSEVLHETKKEQLSMAPNSNFDYTIGWGQSAFKSGKYRMEMVAKSGDKEWKWTERFEIKKEEAKKHNDKAVDIDKQGYRLYVVMASIVSLLLVIIGYLIYRLKKIKNK